MKGSYPDAFFHGFANILTQFGIGDFQLVRSGEGKKAVDPTELAVTVGFDGDLQGCLLLTMHRSCAVRIASAMRRTAMDSFDETVRRMIVDFASLLAENACAALKGIEVTAFPSAATLMYGNFSAGLSSDRIIRYAISLEGMPLTMYVSMREK